MKKVKIGQIMKNAVLTDWVKYNNEDGWFWRREGSFVISVQYPIDKPFKMPEGFLIDKSKLLQNVEEVSIPISAKSRIARVPILDGALPTVACAETIYFADGVGDSHHINYMGKITIPVSGEYIYQIKGMPVVKSKFHAGDVIDYPVVFLFRVGA